MYMAKMNASHQQLFAVVKRFFVRSSEKNLDKFVKMYQFCRKALLVLGCCRVANPDPHYFGKPDPDPH